MENIKNQLYIKSGTKKSFDNFKIQGINFNNSNVKNTSFSNVKAGLTLTWKLGIIVFCLVLCIISEIGVFWSGSTIIYLNKNWIVTLILFSVFIAFILSVMLREFRASLVLFTIIVFALIVLSLAISPSSNDYIKTYAVPLLIGSILEIGIVGGFTILVNSNLILETINIISIKFWFSISLIILSLIIGVYIAVQRGMNIDYSKSPESVITSLYFTIFLTALAVYISYRSQAGDPKYRVLRSLAITICSIKGTNFQEADLTDADFTEATLGNTTFTKANLTRTCWRNARNLDTARVEGTYLENEKIRQLVVTGDGRDRNFDGLDLRGCNLRNADLTDASFIGAKLSEATLEGANLTRAKLVKAQLYGTNLTNAILTGACIQDWAISLDTQLEGIKCEYIYMRLETKEDPDPWRKPDNRNEKFKDGDFTDFIAPIIKTQKLYQTQNVDLRKVAENYTILDLFHYEGVDPSAAAIAFQKLVEKYPEAGLRVLSIEGRGNEKINFKAQVNDDISRSLLSQEYNEIYKQVQSGSYKDLLALLAGVNEKDKHIVELRNLLETALKQNKFYIETYQQSSGNITISSVQGNISGVVGGDLTGTVDVSQGDTQITGERNIQIDRGDYRETSINEQGTYVEGDAHHDSQQKES
jgi:uncharacterized protein YjbI with pentapeptide repeats